MLASWQRLEMVQLTLQHKMKHRKLPQLRAVNNEASTGPSEPREKTQDLSLFFNLKFWLLRKPRSPQTPFVWLLEDKNNVYL